MPTAKLYFYSVSAVSSGGEGAPSAQVSATPPAPAGDPAQSYQINCGGNAAAPFAADGFYEADASQTRQMNMPINTSLVTNPAPAAVYLSQRNGLLAYQFPNLVPGGSYNVRLHFAEIKFSGPGFRVFNVAINGAQVLEDYDISADAKARCGKCFGVAVVKEFPEIADAAGKITVEFSAVTDVPEINGIEVLPLAARNAPGAPAAPRVALGAQVNVISWNASPGATSYNVYRSLDPGAAGSAIFTSTSSTAVVDACSSATVYYSVQAINGTGSSPLSPATASPAEPGSPPIHISPPPQIDSASVKADFNGDGNSDLIWQNDANGAVGVWMMDGPNRLSSTSITRVTDPHWKIVGSGDFGGDGQPALVWQNDVNGDASVSLMSGTMVQSTVALPHPPDPHWKIVGVGDFDGDGKPDLVWQNSATGQALLWLMNGAKPRACASLPRQYRQKLESHGHRQLQRPRAGRSGLAEQRQRKSGTLVDEWRSRGIKSPRHQQTHWRRMVHRGNRILPQRDPERHHLAKRPKRNHPDGSDAWACRRRAHQLRATRRPRPRLARQEQVGASCASHGAYKDRLI